MKKIMDETRNEVMNLLLQQTIRPEFLNRIDEVIICFSRCFEKK